MTKLITKLAQQLAGEFDNKTQTLAQPVWFVHLHWWYRPLPFRLEGNLALFAEQAPFINLNQPYRQRILVLKETANPQQLLAQYLAFKQPEKFRGAATNLNLLHQISLDDLENLPGCSLTITEQNNTFIAQPEPEAKCYFQYEGKKRQVVLGFEVSPGNYKSYDRGVDPETGAALWGAIMGPYEFDKCLDFAAELPE